MRRNTNLPSLHPTLQTNKSKGSIRNIQEKITVHQSEIARNQKVILSLTNDFRLIKDQLKIKEQENQQLAEMHRKNVEELQNNQSLSKELKSNIHRLQKKLEEKEKKLSEYSPQNLKQLQQKNKQIEKYKSIVNELKQQLKRVENMKNQHFKQIDRLKKQMTFKSKDQSARNRSTVEELERQIISLTQRLIKKQEQIKEIKLSKENEIWKLKEYCKDQEHKISQYAKVKKQIKVLHEKQEQLKGQNQRYRGKIDYLQKELKGKDKQIDNKRQLMDKITHLQSEVISLNGNLNRSNQQKEKLQKQNQSYIKESKQFNKMSQKLLKIKKGQKKLTATSTSLQSSIKCEYCKKLLNNPVTNIPCGHSYCFECKKGYENQCRKCPNVKREAVYRNELLDEIISAFEQINEISSFLN